MGKFTTDYTPAHDHYLDTASKLKDEDTHKHHEDDDIDIALSKSLISNNPRPAHPDSVWTTTGSGLSIYKMYEYNTLDPLSGHHSISKLGMEPPTKRRKINRFSKMEDDTSSPSSRPSSSPNSDRFSLCSLGFQPLAARAIIEELEAKPKLRYSDEFRRDIARTVQCETGQIAHRLSGDVSIQNVFPTSNGRDRRYLFTARGLDPNDERAVDRLKGRLLTEHISTMIYSKQRDKLREKLEEAAQREVQQQQEMVQKAQRKSLEIAKRLGFVPEFVQCPDVEAEDESNDKTVDRKRRKRRWDDAAETVKGRYNERRDATEMMSKGLMAPRLPPPPDHLDEAGNEQNGPHSPFSHFECKSVLKSDGSEYDKILGSKLRGMRKYDANFCPMFQITNRDHRFCVVSRFGHRTVFVNAMHAPI